jgi:pyruvate dehydrogenase E1 component alpha subunit
MSAVHAAARSGIEQCRSGNGPVFIEAITVRWPGSNPLWPELATTTDLTTVWDRSKIQGPHADWLCNHDPLLRTVHELLKAGHASQDEIMKYDEQARGRIASAVSFALESPWPLTSTVADHIMAGSAK